MESIKKTSEMVTLIRNLKLGEKLDNVDKRVRKGLRRSTRGGATPTPYSWS